MTTSKKETLGQKIIPSLMSTLIAAAVIALISLVSTVIQLKAFADEGKRYTKEDAFELVDSLSNANGYQTNS